MKIHRSNLIQYVKLMEIQCQYKNIIFEIYISKKDKDHFFVFKHEVEDYYSESGLIALKHPITQDQEFSLSISKINRKIETNDRIGTFCHIESLSKNLLELFEISITIDKHDEEKKTRVKNLMRALRNKSCQ